MSTLDDLIAAALGGIPRLPGARCKGRSRVWDEHDDPELVEYAQSQCQVCRAKPDCEIWFDSLRPRSAASRCRCWSAQPTTAAPQTIS